MTKSIAVLSSGKSPNAEAVKEYFKDKDVEIIETDSLFEAAECDLCVTDGFKGHTKNEILECTQFLNIHYSLLPAFDCENPIKAAFEAGVKVSGVTFHYLNDDEKNKNGGKIIAQYPVFIDYTTTLEELEEEMHKLSQKLAPFVIESILDDVIFNFGMLLNPHDCGGCGGCKGKN